MLFRSPELMTNLDVRQDHEAQRGEIGDDKEAGVVDLRIDLICNKENNHITVGEHVHKQGKQQKHAISAPRGELFVLKANH